MVQGLHKELKIRSYDGEKDCARVEELERGCEIVGPADRVFLFTDSLGDPICRIRNSPSFYMLVAELDDELVGVVQGSIKLVTMARPHGNSGLARVGYILGLRVAPLHRRRGVGSTLVRSLEQWFVSNHVEFAYMATDKENKASVKLFVDSLGYVKFRTPAILVNPVSPYRALHLPSHVEIKKLRTKEAKLLYRKFMSSAEFFPSDIDDILENRLSLGTWVAYYKGEAWEDMRYESVSTGSEYWRGPKDWAMVSVWNSAEVFKLRLLGRAPLSCLIYTKSCRLMDRFFPCFKIPAIPEFVDPFGFYFMYGVHCEGKSSAELVQTLCQFVRNMARKSKDCKLVVTEIGARDEVRLHIPHWKLLSCPEDLWCIKALNGEKQSSLHEMTMSPPTRALFVDPREV
ncbi:probable N-acetyltransferase HLS1-like [Rhodamnia argentea]|uniref:Probable N-acetyltransferase HLS1-like n=1 Tax=Rhodamnia argentea TaxID=178133 RepID=A0A8B8PRV3_9MYRT|nr:probable N-acetyltransferase HLS1-like [Rhodamnia argentea]